MDKLFSRSVIILPPLQPLFFSWRTIFPVRVVWSLLQAILCGPSCSAKNTTTRSYYFLWVFRKVSFLYQTQIEKEGVTEKGWYYVTELRSISSIFSAWIEMFILKSFGLIGNPWWTSEGPESPTTYTVNACFITTKAAEISSDLVAKLCMDTAPRRSAFLRYTQTKQHAKVLFRDFVVLLLNIQYTKSEPKKNTAR